MYLNKYLKKQTLRRTAKSTITYNKMDVIPDKKGDNIHESTKINSFIFICLLVFKCSYNFCFFIKLYYKLYKA